MADEPNLRMVMELLLDLQHGQRQMRDELRGEIVAFRGDMDAQFALVRARIERVEAQQGAMEALLRQHTRRLDTLTLDITNIRRDLARLSADLQDYHGAVIGHGLHITELDERVRRIEERLGLSRM